MADLPSSPHLPSGSDSAEPSPSPARDEPDDTSAASVPEGPASAVTHPDKPAFARAFPRNAELDAAVDAFRRGDYATVRRVTEALARSNDAQVQAAARKLRERTSADPIAVAIMAGTGLLLSLLTLYWIFHDGP